MGIQKTSIIGIQKWPRFYVSTLTAPQHPADLQTPDNPCIVFPCRHEPDGTPTDQDEAAKTPENQGFPHHVWISWN